MLFGITVLFSILVFKFAHTYTLNTNRVIPRQCINKDSRLYSNIDVEIPEDDVKQRTRIIQSLIDKATSTAQLARLITNNTFNSSYELTRIKFISKYNKEIQMLNETNAIRYLNLPLESYSVLDKKYVSRINDTFILTVPLSTLQEGLDSSTSMGLKLPNYASININVVPTPNLGYIEMKSGDIIFTYNKSKDAVIDYSYDEKTKTASKSNVMPLPKWLVWGAESGSYVDNGNSISIKSSIQSAVTIKLAWISKENPSGFKALFKSAKPVNVTVPANESVLPLQISVLVSIDMNIPIQSTYARFVNFGPIKLIAQQIGSIIGDSLLRVIGKSLIGKLIENYKLRQSQWREEEENARKILAASSTKVLKAEVVQSQSVKKDSSPNLGSFFGNFWGKK